MSENPRRGRQARNFATNVPKLLDLKSSSEKIFFRKLSLGAPEAIASFHNVEFELSTSPFIMGLSTQEPRKRDHINLSKILKLGFL